MEVLHWKECEDKKIAQFPYRGEMHDVNGHERALAFKVWR